MAFDSARSFSSSPVATAPRVEHHHRLHIAAQLPTCLMHGALPCWYDVLQDELAKSVTTEQGKTFQDAKGDVFRGLGEFRLSQ
jgi:hypothetical protein